MTAPAPLLRVHGDSKYFKPLEVVYELWREHHAGCAVCGQHDWYEPGAPRLYSHEPSAADAPLFTAVPLSGGGRRWIYTPREPDLTVLCRVGAQLFDQWRKVSMRFTVQAAAL